jgi:hypothetical protein
VSQFLLRTSHWMVCLKKVTQTPNAGHPICNFLMNFFSQINRKGSKKWFQK